MYTNNLTRYRLDISIETKKAIGFKYDFNVEDYVYEFPVYFDDMKKPAVTCKLGIGDDNEIWYKVYNTDGNIYPAYYDREYGKSSVVETIDKNIEKKLKCLGAKEIKNNKK